MKLMAGSFGENFDWSLGVKYIEQLKDPKIKFFIPNANLTSIMKDPCYGDKTAGQFLI